MNVDKAEVIAGLPIKLARDLLKKMGENQCAFEWFLTEVAVALSGSDDVHERRRTRHRADCGIVKPGVKQKVKALVAEMIKRGWLEKLPKKHGDRYEYYRATDEGGRVSHIRWLKRIPRAKAEQIVAALIQRARAINANPALLMWVTRLRVFGSYITDAADLGDIDVVMELDRRETDGRRFTDASTARAKASGKRIVFPHTLYYGETEVQLLLKSRDRYLSFHPLHELEKLQAESRVIYEREESWRPN